jgi:hypothetical protein
MINDFPEIFGVKETIRGWVRTAINHQATFRKIKEEVQCQI